MQFLITNWNVFYKVYVAQVYFKITQPNHNFLSHDSIYEINILSITLKSIVPCAYALVMVLQCKNNFLRKMLLLALDKRYLHVIIKQI